MQWDELLDDMERRLTEVERGLRTGSLEVTALTVPDDMEALPTELRTRAAHALRMTLAAQAEVEATRERIADTLRRGRTTVRQPAAYLDTRI